MSEPPTIQLYGRRNSINVMKVAWCCAEIGLEVNRVDVGGDFAFDNYPDYLELNPNGRVPTIVDGDITLWESNVIVRYLSETYGKGGIYPTDPTQRWEAEKWMDWQQTTLNPSHSMLLRQTVRLSPEKRDKGLVDGAVEEGSRLWPMVDALLAERSYITGGTFTMGDIPLGCQVYRWYAYDIKRPSLPNLERWYERLKTREKYLAHVEQPLT